MALRNLDHARLLEISHALGRAVLFIIPIKLSFTYILIIPAMLIWLPLRWDSLYARVQSASHNLLFFFSTALLTSMFGFDPVHSILNITTLGFFVLCIPFFAELLQKFGVSSLLLTLAAGQSTAALHSVLEGALPGVMPKAMIGKIAESGQLGLVLIATLGLWIRLRADQAAVPFRTTAIAAVNSVLFAAAGLSGQFCNGLDCAWWLLVLLVPCGALTYWHISRAPRERRAELLIGTLALPLMVAALLINLKRGPWIGSCCGILLLLLLTKRHRMLLFALATVAVALALEPVRMRLMQSGEHFYIHGGRSVIWEIAAELIVQYPLGVGWDNSGILQKFSTQVPQQLTHFHNNLLNVAVETGWLGLLSYIFWIAGALYWAFSVRHLSQIERMTAWSLGAALVSWQIAGVVEYNFGDSEVVFIAIAFCGFIAAIYGSAGDPAAAEDAAACGARSAPRPAASRLSS